MVTFRFTPIVE